MKQPDHPLGLGGVVERIERPSGLVRSGFASFGGRRGEELRAHHRTKRRGAQAGAQRPKK